MIFDTLRDLLAIFGGACFISLIVLIISGVISNWKDKNKMICTKCGHRYEWYYHYCPSCGGKLERRERDR